jgi:hypothetical protein
MRTICCLVAIAGASAAAMADTVQLRFDNVGAGRNVRMSIGTTSFNCFAGQLIHNFSGGTGAASGLTGDMITFCSDLTQEVTRTGATYTLTGIQNLPQTIGFGPMGDAKKQAIYDMYSAASGQQMGTNADMAAAFQLAIWEVIYDYNGNASSLNLTSGQLRAGSTTGGALSSGILSDASFLFGAIGRNAAQTGLLGLSNGLFQDQILQTVQLVPLPLASLAGLLGLGVVAYVKRRRLAR